jgi:hypothetical protein
MPSNQEDFRRAIEMEIREFGLETPVMRRIDDIICRLGDAKNEIAELFDADKKQRQETIYGYRVKDLAIIAQMLRRYNYTPAKLAEVLAEANTIAGLYIEEMFQKMRDSVIGKGVE